MDEGKDLYPDYPDEFVREIYRAKEAYSARFNHDIRALCRHIRALEATSGRTYVDFSGEGRKEGAADEAADEPTAPELAK